MDAARATGESGKPAKDHWVQTQFGSIIDRLAQQQVDVVRGAGLGSKNVRFIALWDGKGGDGPGGTEHMYQTVQNHAGRSTTSTPPSSSSER